MQIASQSMSTTSSPLIRDVLWVDVAVADNEHVSACSVMPIPQRNTFPSQRREPVGVDHVRGFCQREVVLDCEPRRIAAERQRHHAGQLSWRNPMKTSDEVAELLEVDRTTLVGVDVLPQAELRTADHLCVSERRSDREAFRNQPSRQRHLAGHVRRLRSHSDHHVARAEDVVGTDPQLLDRVLDSVPTSSHGCQSHRMLEGQTIGMQRRHRALCPTRRATEAAAEDPARGIRRRGWPARRGSHPGRGATARDVPARRDHRAGYGAVAGRRRC